MTNRIGNPSLSLQNFVTTKKKKELVHQNLERRKKKELTSQTVMASWLIPFLPLRVYIEVKEEEPCNLTIAPACPILVTLLLLSSLLMLWSRWCPSSSLSSDPSVSCRLPLYLNCVEQQAPIVWCGCKSKEIYPLFLKKKNFKKNFVQHPQKTRLLNRG